MRKSRNAIHWRMITDSRVRQIAGEVAAATLRPTTIEAVQSEPATDSEGREALRITIVIKPGAAAKLNGDSLLDTLVEIQGRLPSEGEERLAIVEYATKEELEESGDS